MIRGKGTTSSLINTAIWIRGYMSLLFADEVEQLRKTSQISKCEYKWPSDNYLALQVFNFILFRLNECFTEVLNAVRQSRNQVYASYKIDVSGAAAILYTGLINIRTNLQSGTLKPLCVSLSIQLDMKRADYPRVVPNLLVFYANV